jgi:hypothetical protein
MMNLLCVFPTRRPQGARLRFRDLLIVVALALGAGFNRPVLAQAQTKIEVEEIKVDYTFGGQMTFSLAAHGDIEITSANLLIRVGDGRTSVSEVAITPPSLRVELKSVRDLQVEAIPPFSKVTYSWRLTNANGQQLATSERDFIYDDNRFQWQAIQRPPVVAHWYQGDLAFGQAVADIGYQALNRAARFINAQPPSEVHVYAYATPEDLQAGLRLGGRNWVAGHADPSLGVVLVYSAPIDEGLLELENLLPHEMTHVMVYQAVGSNYARMPVWLDEGLAVNNELQPNAEYTLILNDALQADALLPLNTLCGPFSADQSRFYLSYAQSKSIVRYILDRWGPASVESLLKAYGEGATCEGGVQRVLNLSLAELQTAWESDVLRASPLTKFIQDVIPGVAVFILPAIIIAFFLFVPRRKSPQPPPTLQQPTVGPPNPPTT